MTPKLASAPSFVVRLMRVLAGILLGLVLSEGIARLVLEGRNWTPGSAFAGDLIRPSPGGGFTFAGDLDTVFRPPWRDAKRLITDPHGWRVPAGPRPPARESLVVCGASYTWGFNVEAEESWPFLLEARLRTAGRDLRVHNLAQLGLTLPLMLASLEQLPEDIRPERCLIAVPLTGLYILGLGLEADGLRLANREEGVASLAEGLGPEGARLEEVNGWLLRDDRPGRGTLTDELWTRSVLGHRFLYRMRRVEGSALQLLEEKRDLDLLSQRAKQIGERLRATVKRLRDRGCRTDLVLLPANFAFLQRSFTDEDMVFLRDFYRASGALAGEFQVWDLTRGDDAPRLSAEPGGDYFLYDPHYAPSGHRKIADAVATRILAELPR
ncbi:MAG: SGNH/GDSL hydrolase family protein [Planctomycetes bacterium]|nr:SGNH/GDSL hydrolase family protein [Planctomycetota bacterium]